MEFLQRLDTLTPKQVIEVPKISQGQYPAALWTGDVRRQLVEVPTVVSYSSCSSRLPSRTWTFQFLALVVIMEVSRFSPKTRFAAHC